MAMASDSDLLKRTKLRFDRRAPERLRAADDSLAYLEERESDEATADTWRCRASVTPRPTPSRRALSV